MTPEEYLEKARVNPNERIDTNDGSFWKLNELLHNYDESKNHKKTVKTVVKP